MDKEIKARKSHNCDICEGNIKKGDFYIFGSERQPRYDKDENQIGIEYISWAICLDCDKEAKEDAENAKIHDDEFY